MYYTITICRAAETKESSFTTAKMMTDAFNLLSDLNYVEKIFFENTEISFSPIFYFKEVIQKSFNILVHIPDVSKRFNIAIVAQNVEQRLLKLGFQELYSISHVFGPHNDEDASAVKTINQYILEETAFKEDGVPENFLCGLSNQLMDTPVRLSNNVIVDWKVIARSLTNNPANPFDKTPLTINELAQDVALKKEIRDFIVVDVLSRDLIEIINAWLDVSERLHTSPLSPRNNNSLWKTAYPNKTQTIATLKEAFHALCQHNLELFESIVKRYPRDAQINFYKFANRHTSLRFNIIDTMQHLAEEKDRGSDAYRCSF